MNKNRKNARIDRDESKVDVTFVDDVKILDYKDEVSFEAKRGDVVSMVRSSASFHILRGNAVEGDHAEKIASEDEAAEAAEDAENLSDVELSEAEEKAAAEAKDKATKAKAEAELEEKAALEAIDKATKAKAEAEKVAVKK